MQEMIYFMIMIYFQFALMLFQCFLKSFYSVCNVWWSNHVHNSWLKLLLLLLNQERTALSGTANTVIFIAFHFCFVYSETKCLKQGYT